MLHVCVARARNDSCEVPLREDESMDGLSDLLVSVPCRGPPERTRNR